MQAEMESPAREVARNRNIPIVELTPSLGEAAGLFSLSCNASTRIDSSKVNNGGFSHAEDIALVLHTSGTTSRPKIVPLTQLNVCTSVFNVGRALQLTAQDRCLNVMPLFRIHGLIAAIRASLASGSSVVCTPGFYAPRFFEWLDGAHPTWYTAVPTMHRRLFRAAGQREIIERNPLRLIRSSSSALPPQVMAEYESLSPVNASARPVAIFLRNVLARYLKIKPQTVMFTLNAHDKPFLHPDVITCDSPLHFNLSHSQNLALCAVSAAAPVGVDVELIRPDFNWKALAPLCLNHFEENTINNTPKQDRHRLFLDYWICKEAILKARGCGL